MTTATVLAQDKLEALGTVTFARLVDPAKMVSNPKAHGTGRRLHRRQPGRGHVGRRRLVLLRQDHSCGTGRHRAGGNDHHCSTRRHCRDGAGPTGTIANTNPFSDDRISYSRRWVIMSSSESEPADRRLTVAVRVGSEYATEGRAPELVDLYTVLTGQ